MILHDYDLMRPSIRYIAASFVHIAASFVHLVLVFFIGFDLSKAEEIFFYYTHTLIYKASEFHCDGVDIVEDLVKSVLHYHKKYIFI